jgi:hypothetical protein
MAEVRITPMLVRDFIAFQRIDKKTTRFNRAVALIYNQ